jgi:hypothetical protein
MCERQLVDPENKYDFGGPLQVDTVALQLIELLPGAILERTRDVIQFELREEPGLVLLVTAEAIEVRLPTVEWTRGSHGPAPSSRYWKRIKIPGSGQLNMKRMESLIEEARSVRAAEFVTCRFCKKDFPPEHGHDDDVCHGCAEQHLGVVH